MMNSKLDFEISNKEQVYFYIRLIISLAFYFLIVKLIILSFSEKSIALNMVYAIYGYIILIILIVFFRFGILIGYLRGNAVKLGKNQFPDIYDVVIKQSELLGLKRIPHMYILQSGGLLNAFATKFLGRNYIVLYSEIVETAYEQDIKILEFVIGHELGHIKRNHLFKKIILLPSDFIPFLGAAYSRACENTCDSIGYSLCPAGVRSGLLLLASGKSIYKKVNITDFINQDITEYGFWKWFAEIISSHPQLTKRLARFNDLKEEIPVVVPSIAEEQKEDDLSRFMPR